GCPVDGGGQCGQPGDGRGGETDEHGTSGDGAEEGPEVEVATQSWPGGGGGGGRRGEVCRGTHIRQATAPQVVLDTCGESFGRRPAPGRCSRVSRLRGVSVRSFLSRLVYGLHGPRLIQQAAGRHPRHIGIVLDGNRRWAREARLTDVNHGHRAGAEKIADFLGWCREAGVEVVTIWLLSTDNLHNRSEDELSALLEIIPKVVDEFARPDTPWQVRLLGAIDELPTETAQRLTDAAARTEGRAGMVVNVAVGYGG